MGKLPVHWISRWKVVCSTVSISLWISSIKHLKICFSRFTIRFLPVQPTGLPLLTRRRPECHNIFANIGSVRNTGLEVAMDVDAIRTKDWKWNIGLNLTTIHTKLQNCPAVKTFCMEHRITVKDTASMNSILILMPE